jgi:hypothetical protein
MQPGGNERGRHGPYVTHYRASQVAAQFRSRGYNASVFTGGTINNRQYYVDVW